MTGREDTLLAGQGWLCDKLGCGGSLIRHALSKTLPPFSFCIPMVFSTFIGAPMLGTGAAVRPPPSIQPAGETAVNMSAIAAAVYGEKLHTVAALDEVELQGTSTQSEDLDLRGSP